MTARRHASRWPWSARWTRDEFKLGDHNVICDRTGFKVKASDTKREWNNLIVREQSWETRQPQDFVRGRGDRQSVPHPRPEPETDTFVDPGVVKASDL